jgi:prepilin-type N-terminal cleavage/methylation domain-containing protein
MPVPNQRPQRGFTLVEVVAVMVIAVTLAAWAMPRMDSASDVGASAAASQLVAALQYAQVLAQRQGKSTKVEMVSTNPQVIRVRYADDSEVALLPDESYWRSLHPDVSISPIAPCLATISFGADGMPSSGPPCTYQVRQDGVSRFEVKVEPTGYAYRLP